MPAALRAGALPDAAFAAVPAFDAAFFDNGRLFEAAFRGPAWSGVPDAFAVVLVDAPFFEADRFGTDDPADAGFAAGDFLLAALPGAASAAAGFAAALRAPPGGPPAPTPAALPSGRLAAPTPRRRAGE